MRSWAYLSPRYREKQASQDELDHYDAFAQELRFAVESIEETGRSRQGATKVTSLIVAEHSCDGSVMILVNA